ncbi:MAG: AbrB/MazE/SpoVT family DNA-binding domain-containing protein [Candidatus Micrarchaeia archaeon]
MSSKGQVVIPEGIREMLNLESGSRFVVYAHKDSVLFKKLAVPDPVKEFEEMSKWGTEFAKSKRIDTSPAAIVKRIHEGRGIKK